VKSGVVGIVEIVRQRILYPYARRRQTRLCELKLGGNEPLVTSFPFLDSVYRVCVDASGLCAQRLHRGEEGSDIVDVYDGILKERVPVQTFKLTGKSQCVVRRRAGSRRRRRVAFVCALLATYGGNEFIRSSSPLRQGSPPIDGIVSAPAMDGTCVMIM
jgi:hypothetical protein